MYNDITHALDAKAGIDPKDLKPTYDVEFWEYVYDLELKRYMLLLEKKARRLKYLKRLNLFSLSEKRAEDVYKQATALESELQILYGMKLFMDEMKNCYLDSSCKIQSAFSHKNMELEILNDQLKTKLLTLLKQAK